MCYVDLCLVGNIKFKIILIIVVSVILDSLNVLVLMNKLLILIISIIEVIIIL